MPEAPQRQLRRKGLIACLLAVLAMGGAWWARAPILAGLARPLVADDPVAPGCYLWIHTEDGVFPDATPCYEIAARLAADDRGRRILLIDTQPARLAEFGVLPPFAAAARARLEARGVPVAAIEVLPGARRGLAAELPVLARFLDAHPDAHVQLLAGRFDSAADRRTIDKGLAPAQAARVRVCAIPHPAYDETNWWRSRNGVREFVLAWIKRLYGGEGDDQQATVEWNPDAYERSLTAARPGDPS